MSENIENDFDRNFIFAFHEFIEIFLSLGMKKNDLVEKILGLSRELNLIISEREIFIIYEKLKIRYKFEAQRNPITFISDADEEMSVNFEGEYRLYI